jgi:tartrate dehydrogenase/decarboxylase / D-malate dehydrogenase
VHGRRGDDQQVAACRPAGIETIRALKFLLDRSVGPDSEAISVPGASSGAHPMRRYRIAVIPGDGIGKEVIPAGLEVLESLAQREGGFEFAFDQFDWGSDYYRAVGLMMPHGGREQIRDHDAIYFGAVGAPGVPDHISLWGLRLAICQPFDQYANVRPARVLPGIVSPLRHVSGPELDWVIVRENSEGEYAGVGGRVHQGLPSEVATDVTVMTRSGVERIFRFAFALARSRPRKLLTIVTKSNAQRHAMVMWDEIGAEIAREFADVTWDKMLVDAMTMRMTIKPETLDTIVASNLHADILSDLAAALAGSLGIAPTANLNPERQFPSMFEPIHGSAFDIAGKGIANPIGSFWTGAMMLEHLGEKAAADRLMRAIERVTSDASLHTPDLCGAATTRAVTDAVIAAIRDQNFLKDEVTASGTGSGASEP